MNFLYKQRGKLVKKSFLGFITFNGFVITSLIGPFFISFWVAVDLTMYYIPLEKHYIWEFIQFVFYISIPCLLCGAVTKEKSGIITCISIIPGLIFFYSSIPYSAMNYKGFTAVSIIMLPVLMYIGYKIGELGSYIQREYFSKIPYENCLGLAWYHWILLGLPIGVYITISYINFEHFLYLRFWSEDIITTKIWVYLFLQLFMFVFSLFLIYNILKFEKLVKYNRAWMKLILIFAILLLACFLGWVSIIHT